MKSNFYLSSTQNRVTKNLIPSKANENVSEFEEENVPRIKSEVPGKDILSELRLGHKMASESWKKLSPG